MRKGRRTLLEEVLDPTERHLGDNEGQPKPPREENELSYIVFLQDYLPESMRKSLLYMP